MDFRESVLKNAEVGLQPNRTSQTKDSFKNQQSSSIKARIN
jgi:hypothetical protein